MTKVLSEQVRKALGAESVQMAAWIGAGGVGFTVANLVLAGVLEADAFGRLALYEAILAVCGGLAPLGLDSLVVRREVGVSYASVGWFTACGLLAGGLGTLAGVMLYGLSVPVGLLLVITCVAISVNQLFSSGARAEMRFRWSQVLFQLPNFVFLAGVLGVALVSPDTTWVTAAVVLACGYLLAALLGFTVRLRRSDGMGSISEPRGTADGRQLLVKAMSFVGIGGAVLILDQVEKLVIARYLTMEQLGTFAVAVTVVGSPFRLLQRGVGYVLMPRLRSTSDVGDRRSQVGREIRIVSVLGLCGSVLLVLAADPLIEFVYGAKYDVSPMLILVLVAVGNVRLLYGVASSALSGLGEGRQLVEFAVLSWLGLAIAFAGAVFLRGLGLAGVVAGAAVGWLVGAAAGAGLVRSHFREDRAGHEEEGVAPTTDG